MLFQLGSFNFFVSLDVKQPSYRQHAAAATKSPQSCPTLCNPIDDNPPGSAVPGILQARTLEWVAISFSRGSPGGVSNYYYASLCPNKAASFPITALASL